jgi:hypothetical protein
MTWVQSVYGQNPSFFFEKKDALGKRQTKEKEIKQYKSKKNP